MQDIKFLFLVLIFIVSLIGISAVSAADDVTEDIVLIINDETILKENISDGNLQESPEEGGVLSDGEDPSTESSLSIESFSKLNEDINNGEDEVNLSYSYRYSADSDSAFENGVNIIRDVIINGNGCFIDGNQSARIFNILSGTVILKNINFVNAHVTIFTDGAAIHSAEGAKVTAINCNFTSNHAEGSGGAIYGADAINCSFINNIANTYGGAITNGNAVNCTFDSNKILISIGTNFEGGAIYNGNATNCIFINNSAYFGGALCESDAVDCTFIENHAVKSGGAMYEGYATNCIFTNNTADFAEAIAFGTADSCFFYGNSYEGTTIYNPFWNMSFVVLNYGDENNLTIKLNAHNGHPISNANIKIDLYTLEREFVGTYNAISDGWIITLDAGSYIAVFNATDYDINLTEEDIIINKAKSEITSSNVTTIYNDDKDLVITLKDNKGKALIGETVTVMLDGLQQYTTDENGQIKVNIAKLMPKIYDATIIFDGNSNYLGSSTAVKVEVGKGNTTVSSNNVTTVYNEDGFLIISLKDAKGNALVGQFVSVDLGGVQLYLTDENGNVKINVGKLVPKNYTAVIGFAGDDYYLNSSTTAKVEVNKMSSALSSNNVTTVYNEDGFLLISLKDVNGNALVGQLVSVDLGGVQLYLTDENGNVNITVGKLVPKNYTAVIGFAGNDYYLNSSTAAKVEVNKMGSALSSNNVTTVYNEDGFLIISLKDANGNALVGQVVSVDLGGVQLYLTDENGNVKINVGKLVPKNYTAVIGFAGNDYYLNSSATANVEVNKIGSVLSSNNVTTVYNDDGFLLISLKDVNGNALAGQVVSVDLGGVRLYVTDENGSIGINVGKLVPKNYTAVIGFAGDDYYLNSYTTSKVDVSKESSALSSNNVTTVYNEDGFLIISLKDAKGNALVGQVVSVDLGGVRLYVTDENGNIKINVGKLVPKSYDALISFGGNAYYLDSSTSAKVTVNKEKSVVISNAVTTIYNKNNYLIITLKDSKGNPLSGETVTVTLGTAKKYKADKNGQIKINVAKEVPKTYTAKISFAGNTNFIASSTTAKVVVKKATPKMTAKAKTFKVGVKTKKYAITLKDNLNKVMKNTKVTLTVNKKTYTVKTNSKGVATFKITNLKKKGKFTAVIKYAGNKYYNKLSKKAIITVKK